MSDSGRIITLNRLLVVMMYLFLVLFTNKANATYEKDTNLPGMDYKSFWIHRDTEAFVAVKRCQDACKNESKCKAFTYVKPGIQGKDGRCYLKQNIPTAVKDKCCYSGILRPLTKHDYCTQYTKNSLLDNTIYLQNKCGKEGGMWSSDYRYHFDWCMRVPKGTSGKGADMRKQILQKCKSPTTEGDLSVIDWCYRKSDNKIQFYPIIMNSGKNTWRSAKQGNILFGCTVSNTPNLLINNANVPILGWPKGSPLLPGEISVLKNGCSYDFPVWNSNDIYGVGGWLLEHQEDIRLENNKRDNAHEISAKDINEKKYLHKECKDPDDYKITTINIWALGMEITQAIQEWTVENKKRRESSIITSAIYPDPTKRYDAAILIKGRSTVVRLYGTAESRYTITSLTNVPATLRCYQDSAYTQPCPGPQRLSPRATVGINSNTNLHNKRRQPALSWNFRLPDSWLNLDRIWLEGTVNESIGNVTPIQECIDCFDASNRIRIGNIPFFESPDFNAIFEIVSIRNTYGSLTTEPTENDLEGYMDFIRRTYPVNEDFVQTIYNTTLEYTQTSNVPNVECSKLHPFLIKNLKLNGKKALHAFISAPYPCAGAGAGKYAFSQVGGDVDAFAHELGHALGLPHAGPPPGHGSRCEEHKRKGENCAECQNGWCDPPDWPWPHGTIGGFGFDVLDPNLDTVYEPESTSGVEDESKPHDFMSYGGSPWISQRNWTRLYNAMMDKSFPYRKKE